MTAGRVWYVTMAFPEPTETFAGTDVRVLRASGVDVSVHCLRPAHRDAASMLRDWELSDLPVTFNSMRATLRGMSAAVRRPKLLVEVIGWLVREHWRRPSHLARGLVLLPRSFEIADAIERQRPDVVHLFWGHFPGIVGFLVQRARVPVILSVFLGAYDLVRDYGGRGTVARRAAVVWTHAEVNVPAIERLGVPGTLIRVAHRGVDFRRFPPTGTAKVPHRIVSVGRLVPGKAMDEVLDVFRRVRSRWPDSTLHVAGDGPERSRLEALAESAGIRHAVTFRGYVPHDRIRAELDPAEVFLFMSHNESERLPNVVKEAMSSRCLCVVADSPGMTELVTDGVTGFIVPPGDVAAAARRIDDAFTGQADPERIVAAALDDVHARFDARRTMEIYRQCWSELANGRPAGAAVTDPYATAASAVTVAGQ